MPKDVTVKFVPGVIIAAVIIVTNIVNNKEDSITYATKSGIVVILPSNYNPSLIEVNGEKLEYQELK